MSRLVVRILWFGVFTLGSTLVLWGLLQDQITLRSDDSLLQIRTSTSAMKPSAGRPIQQRPTTSGPAAAAAAATYHFRPVPGGPSPRLRSPKSFRIWPAAGEREDRILAQMNLIPANPRYDDPEEEKLILLYYGLSAGTPSGRDKFRIDRCPVRNCRLTSDRSLIAKADAVVFEGGAYDGVSAERPPGQIWILFLLESPENVADLSVGRGQRLFNWTATYRLDSTINTPYERFVPYRNATGPLRAPSRNYALGKTKKVAWFVSNCYSTNRRTEYAAELAKYIELDVYGSCGNLSCPRQERKACDRLLSNNYKFYLAFENSNCRDYITEKFYWNALYNDVVPIVMGAHPDDYAVVAPPGSYIHVDDFESPRHLADYLHELDRNDTLYNEYFRWKGTGEFIDTKYWCRLCGLVHEARTDRAPLAMWYEDLAGWWNGPGVCVRPRDGQRWATWRNRNGSSYGGGGGDDVFARPNTLKVIHRTVGR